ncbi:hypothetical protein [Nonomuraea sp. CA-141351]|uniref:hypothetical protein n=1 Tax=Nonomuraea sp. CA-141351 TaxID=3239996 RepID=UPI003D8D6CBD
MAWYLRAEGYDIGPDHLGDDLPAAVRRQCQADMTWLHEKHTQAARAIPGPATIRKEQHS